MEITLTLAFLSIGISTFVLQWKSRNSIIPFIYLILFTAIGLFLLGNVSGGGDSLMVLVGLVAFNFLLSKIGALRKPYIRLLGPLVSIGTYLFIYKDASVELLGDGYPLVNKFLVMGAVLATVSHTFGALKIAAIRKIFGIEDTAGIQRSITILLLGIGMFLGDFAASSIGLFTIAGAYLMASFYEEGEAINWTLPVLAGSTMISMLTLTGESAADLFGGDVLMGIMLGVFGMYLLHELWYAKKRSLPLLLISYLIIIGVALGALFAFSIYPRMGGMDAFIGVMLGVGLAQVLIGKGFIGISLIAWLIAGGSVLPQMLVNEEEAAFQQEMVGKEEGNEESIEEEIIQYAPLSDLKGTFKLNPENAKVSFVLGKKGETKGAFKQVNGTVVLAEEVEKSSFEIQLDLEDFTTFVSYRDESLMGPDYFDQKKFPGMTFKGTKLVKKEGDFYEIQGEFTMLGVSNPLNVTVARVEEEGKNVLIGEGKIDRTTFGMSPSATEGNVVSFEYKVELK